MSWEVRQNRKYYYRVRRNGNCLVKSYFGSGVAARRAAAEDAQRRAAREKSRTEYKQLQALDAQLQALAKVTKTFVKASFYGAGFHQYKREWRRRRGNNTSDEGQDLKQNGALTLGAETATYEL